MKRPYLKRVMMILTGLLIMSGVAHALILPQQTRCLLVEAYDFEQEGALFYRATAPADSVALLQNYILRGQQQVSQLFGEPVSVPSVIYCSNREDFRAFGSYGNPPALTHMHFGARIVVQTDGIHPDIIAHEMAHAQLFASVGMLRNHLEIPYWFHEGMALQVDHRAQYGEAHLRELSNDLTQLPDMRSLQTAADFFNGDYVLHYAAARHVVNQWYSPERLQQFITDVNDGMPFDDAYGADY